MTDLSKAIFELGLAINRANVEAIKATQAVQKCPECNEPYKPQDDSQTECDACGNAKYWDALYAQYEENLATYQYMEEHGLLDPDMREPQEPGPVEF